MGHEYTFFCENNYYSMQFFVECGPLQTVSTFHAARGWNTLYPPVELQGMHWQWNYIW